MNNKLVRCSSSPGCGAVECGRFKPHKPHNKLCGEIYCLGNDVDCAPVDPQPTMICPDVGKCVRKYNVEHCYKPHGFDALYCDGAFDFCPPCVPVEQPKEPPAPLDLDAITERYRVQCGTLGQQLTDALALIGEVGRLGSAHANILADLALCQSEVERLGQECDELLAYWEESLRTSDGLVGDVITLTFERDELRDELDIAREAQAIVKKWNNELGRQNDELRARLAQAEQMRCTGDDDPDAEDLIPDMICNEAEGCTNMRCPANGPHAPGSHEYCGRPGFCGWVGHGVRCVEVAE